MAAKTETSTININKYSYSKDKTPRYAQLSAYFHMLKSDLGDTVYAEFIANRIPFYMPYSFNIYETMCYAIQFKPDVMYVEKDADNYIEITFDEVTINGTSSFIKRARDIFFMAESFKSIFGYYLFDFGKFADWLFKKFKAGLYDTCIAIGNEFIRNGSLKIYPLEEGEYFAVTKEDFEATPLNQVEYIVLRSNIQMDKMICIDLQRNIVMATGLDELEKLKIEDMLKPEA